jgi:hypothetical protein
MKDNIKLLFVVVFLALSIWGFFYPPIPQAMAGNSTAETMCKLGVL